MYEPNSSNVKAVFHNSLWYEFAYTFGVPSHDETDYFQWEFINFTRLGHARLLYPFFETPLADRGRKDDVLAEDFGFQASRIGLAEVDRQRLNKDLFHLTYSRLRHTPQTKPWPSSIISCLHSPCVAFIKHILRQGALFDDDQQRDQWRALLSALQSGRELVVRCPVGVDGIARYVLGLGRVLPEGKPAFTLLTSQYEMADADDGTIVKAHQNLCLCCQCEMPIQEKRICPLCRHEFQGNGWDGIDAHWRAKHESVMKYERFWSTLCPDHRGRA